MSDGPSPNDRRWHGEHQHRAQLVLLAAAVIAIALVPMALAYLQLGYHADVAATAEHGDPTRNAERVLERAVHDASSDVAGEYAWAERSAAIDHVDRSLSPAIDRLESARVEAGIGYVLERNASAADRWATDRCPRGDRRAFGPCRSDDGVVIQERAGETVVLGVAFDLHVLTDRGTTDVTLLVRAVGDKR